MASRSLLWRAIRCLPGALLILTLAPPQVARADSYGATERVSISSTGEEAYVPQGWGSEYPAISADGRYIAFVSDAVNLVPNDTNGFDDIFVHDRTTGSTERVSISSTGEQANGWSWAPTISPDGRYVAFESTASNLVPGDTNSTWDAFVYDRETGATERVSVSGSGQEGNGNSGWPNMSADGRFVAFWSRASNLVPDDTNLEDDIFVRDRLNGTTERVSVSSVGEQANGESVRLAMNSDGRYVAFESEASNLVSGDTNGWVDVFVHDRETHQTTRVNVSTTGEQANDHGLYLDISGDGRYVAFSSYATNLIPTDANWGISDIFVHDRVLGRTEVISVSSEQIQGNDYSYMPHLSDDGRYVAFMSYATNLVPGDAPYSTAVFVHDRISGETALVSISTEGQPGDSYSDQPALSSDGRYVAFSSRSGVLVPGDTNGKDDVFVHRLTLTSCGTYALPVQDEGQLVPTPGSAAGPGGALSLTVREHQATAWSGPEWKPAGDAVWQSAGQSGSATPGTPFTVNWTVPATPGAYDVRVQLTDAQGGISYTDVIRLTLPGIPQLTASGRGQANIHLSWTRESGTRFVVERYPSEALVAAEVDTLTTLARGSAWDNSLNGVANGSFEAGTDEAAFPIGWSVVGSGSYALDSTVHCWGARSLKLSHTAAGDTEAIQDVFVGPGLAGRPVAGTAWVKLSEVSGPVSAGAILSMRFYDRQGQQLDAVDSQPLQGTADWTRVWAKGRAPDGTWSVVVSVGLKQATGTLWADGVSVTPAGGPPSAYSPGPLADYPYYYRVLAWNGPLYNVSAPVMSATAGFPDYPGAWADGRR